MRAWLTLEDVEYACDDDSVAERDNGTADALEASEGVSLTGCDRVGDSVGDGVSDKTGEANCDSVCVECCVAVQLCDELTLCCCDPVTDAVLLGVCETVLSGEDDELGDSVGDRLVDWLPVAVPDALVV